MEEKTAATKTKEPTLKKVFICSPFRPEGNTREEKEKNWRRNIDRAHEACSYAVEKGCIPYAPHLYFPQFLSEADEEEREIGILMGLTWLARCDEIWIVGLRISEGMSREIDAAKEMSIPMKLYLPFKDGRNRLADIQIVTEEEIIRSLDSE